MHDMSVPHCINCGYCLGGLPKPRCPECGTPFDPEDPSTFIIVRPPDHHDRVLNRFMIIAVAAVVFTVICLVVFAVIVWFRPACLGPWSWT